MSDEKSDLPWKPLSADELRAGPPRLATSDGPTCKGIISCPEDCPVHVRATAEDQPPICRICGHEAGQHGRLCPERRTASASPDASPVNLGGWGWDGVHVVGPDELVAAFLRALPDRDGHGRASASASPPSCSACKDTGQFQAAHGGMSPCDRCERGNAGVWEALCVELRTRESRMSGILCDLRDVPSDPLEGLRALAESYRKRSSNASADDRERELRRALQRETDDEVRRLEAEVERLRTGSASSERRIEERLVVTGLCDVIGTRYTTGLMEIPAGFRIVDACRRAVNFIEGREVFNRENPGASPSVDTKTENNDPEWPPSSLAEIQRRGLAAASPCAGLEQDEKQNDVLPNVPTPSPDSYGADLRVRDSGSVVPEAEVQLRSDDEPHDRKLSPDLTAPSSSPAPHVHVWTRTSPDILFCFKCQTAIDEPEDK